MCNNLAKPVEMRQRQNDPAVKNDQGNTYIAEKQYSASKYRQAECILKQCQQQEKTLTKRRQSRYHPLSVVLIELPDEFIQLPDEDIVIA
jgi:hypothetical protein